MKQTSKKYNNNLLWLVSILILAGLFAITAPFVMAKEKKGNNSPPEGMIEMTGDYGDYNPEQGIDDPTHDPAIFKDGDTYYVASTGILKDPEDPGGIYLRKSEGDIGGPWESIGEIEVPEWTSEYNVAHLWAPDIAKKGNTYYLYYAASIFGTNDSAIGVATSTTPGDVDSWEDHGPVLTSDGNVNYNAIDPQVFKEKGKWWMVFGSHFSGIHMTELEDMTKPVGPIHDLASRAATTEHNAIEAPVIFKKGKYYYLMTSWDRCCQGTDSTYKVAVGRSESLTGPYVDKNGTSLMEGGGEVFLESQDNQIGPGGQDVLKDRGNYYMVHHYYDDDADGVIRMQIRSMQWKDGWPSFSTE